MSFVKAAWAIVILSFSLMTWAYLVGAHQSGEQVSGIIKYPISGRLAPHQPRFKDTTQKRRNHLHADYPPCHFNTECICSNTGPDLGLVICDDVELGRIPSELNNTKIHTLTLRSNRLCHVDEYAFYGTGMFRLEIRHNLLFSLPEKAFWGVERSIWQLDLRYNRLSKVPSKALKKLRKLSHLDLTGNKISDLNKDDFAGLETSLKTIVMAENSIVNLPNGIFQKLLTVRSIDLRGNNIHFVHDRAFKGASSQLNHLNLANNLLTSIPFEALSGIQNLQTLNLARNRIAKTFKVLFRGSLLVDTLILDQNEIEYLEPYSFQNLKYINRTSLRSNPLTTIHNDAFKGAKIKELYIHDCNLQTISETALRGLESSLQILDLSYNNLSHLPEKVFENLNSVKSLSISHNQLSMDPKSSFNGFKNTLHYLNLLGENMGNFPVDSLKEMSYVRTLGISTIPDSIISKNDFNGFGPAVEKLYLLNNGIVTIGAKAFEHVPGVKILDMSYNSISTIDSEAFVNIGGGLEKLRISSGFSLTRLPPQTMIYLTNVRDIDFSNNDLTHVDGECFRYMRNLRKLNLQDNKIKELKKNHFQGQFHPFLEYIKLSYNSITTIESQTFHHYKTLLSIYLNDNMITNIDRFAFLNLESLQYLYLQGNNINELSFEAFQNLPKLRYLDISFNEMTNLNLDAFEQVGTLSTLTIDASYNRISSLTLNGSMWNSYSGIKMLIFSNNNISSISPNYFESVRSSVVHMWFDKNNMKNISGEIFQNMPHLRLLNFANNHIEVIEPKAFEGSFSLQYLNFCNNRISDLPFSIFEGQKNLRHLDISFNFFRKIPGELLSDSVLEIFRARHNKIKKFPDISLQQSFNSVRVIDLAYNDIPDLKPTILNRFENLVSLDLSHNQIKTIESRAFINLKKLVSLDISNNPIKQPEKISLDGLESSLYEMNLSNVSLKVLPDLKFEHLRELNVSSNKITFLPTQTLQNLSGLRVLDISHNEITTASNNAWQSLPRLKWLLLKNNPMTSLSNDTFIGLQRVEKLDIRQLPLQRFEPGTLAPMEVLREVSITTQPLVHNFNIGQSLSIVPSLQNLVLEVEGALDSQLQGWPLPYKLSNITLTGPRFKKLSNEALKMLNSRELRLTIRQTGLQKVSREFFLNLGKVRFMALAAVNNSLQTLEEPSSTIYPGEPNSIFLTDLRLDGNSWKCDCGIGWIEAWMKSWRMVAWSNSPDAEYEVALRSLRKSKCSGRGHKSLMETLKKDLECGTMSPATTPLPMSVLSLGLLSFLTFLLSSIIVSRIPDVLV